MANPLQPKVIKYLETVGEAYVVNIITASKSGAPDLIACIHGRFFAFEIKWGEDKPSELQKKKINDIIDHGGSAYFIRSVDELHSILTHNIPPIKYELKNKLVL